MPATLPFAWNEPDDSGQRLDVIVAQCLERAASHERPERVRLSGNHLRLPGVHL
jgi:hypothetical protein